MNTASGSAWRHHLAALSIVMAWLPVVAGAEAAPVLRSAEAVIMFSEPASCEVTLSVSVAEVPRVEHRLELIAGAGAELVGVDGATVVGEPRDVGRTRSLMVAPATSGATYTLRYRVTQAAARAYRCPMWLPTTPANGRSRSVRLTVSVPDGTEAAATMPVFAWSGTVGTATLAHLPAIVIVPFVPAGDPRPWDVSRVMDLGAMATLVSGSAWWLRRRRGAR